eukprot:m.25302 g.25302  ORF g.25302 m.25302 type:complete len:54 (+) comp9826_c0_seq1:88-249(+)
MYLSIDAPPASLHCTPDNANNGIRLMSPKRTEKKIASFFFHTQTKKNIFPASS